MPATSLKGRFDRSKIAPLKAERSESSYGFDQPKLVQRQGLPENNFVPEDQTSSDDDSQDEDEDGADESLSEDEDNDQPNPFEPVTTTSSQDQTSITAPSKTSTHTHHSTIGSSTTPTLASSNPPISTDLGTTPSQGLPSTSSTFPSSFITSSTSVLPLPDSSAGPVSTSPVATNEAGASDHPLTKVAIVVPSLLGAVAAIVAVYLLFRYCNPLKARWAVYRARKGRRLPGEEEDGTAPKSSPQMSEADTTRTEVARPSSLPIAPPATARRAPPPLLVRNGSMNNPTNIVVSNQLARSQSNTRSLHDNLTNPPAYTSGGYGAHAFQLQVGEDSTALGPPVAPFSHPNGLANNPPTPVSRNHPPTPSQRHEAVSRVPSMPSPTSLVGDLGMTFPLPPSTPSAAHFPAPSPLGSTFNSPHRLHKSITPSESISNVPESPFPFSPALMPPMPVLNSRWSYNSSSINGRTAPTEEPSPAQRHSAGPGLVNTNHTTLPPPRFPPSKMSSLSVMSTQS